MFITLKEVKLIDPMPQKANELKRGIEVSITMVQEFLVRIFKVR